MPDTAKPRDDGSKPPVIVTGSSGLSGHAVIKCLAGRYRMIGFDRPGIPHPPPEAENVPVDLTDDASVAAGVAHVRERYGESVASVIHLAAYYDFSGEPSNKYETVTVQGTGRLLNALSALQVEQFIFSSTMLVHAPCAPGEKIDEDSPLDPKWDYPKSKVQTEALLRVLHGQTPLVILRVAGVYDDKCHSIPIAHQIQRIYERRLIGRVFPGDIRTGQAFVHLDDVAGAIVRCVDRRGELPPETVMLIGEDQTFSYEQLQRELGRLIHGEPWQTRTIPKALAKAGAWVQDKIPGEEPFIKPWMIDLADDHYALKITRAQTLLGWSPTRSLYSTLGKMADGLKACPAEFYETNDLQIPEAWPDRS